MKIYLGPESSLSLIRYLRSTNEANGLQGKPVRRKTLKDAINTTRGLDELDATAQRWLEHAQTPIHAYVGEKSKGTKTKRLITHVFGNAIPNGAFLELGHDVCICTPQLAFMQLAASYDTVDAIRIGMELCGHYSHWRLEPNKSGDPYYTDYVETRSCTFNLPAAMHSKRAAAFVERQAGLRGAVGARAALRWIADNSASPMETAVYLLLCLPKRLGGYGLPKPTLNPKLCISTPDGIKERYPDLFWQGANVDVEYNSDSKHSGEWSRYQDSKREVELTIANVKVLPLTRQQLMNGNEFDAFAQGLRKMLGIRARSMDLAWYYRRNELRRRLLSSWQQS